MSIKQRIFTPFQLVSKHFFSLALITVLYFGWMQRDDNYLSAETGTGYLLGITGGSLMILLLLYPLSKRLSLLTKLIPIRYWFGVHMLFGIIGPVMILFHSNFHLGSTNSNIALISMLLVAGSGLIGRYIYTHIHHGLYGSRITLKELNQETENNHTELLAMYAMDERLSKRLKTMEEKALQPYTGLLKSLLHIIYMAINAHRLNREVIQLVKDSYSKNQADKAMPDDKVVIHSVNRYTLALRHAAAFKLYERLFSLWHILHLPLFIMMIITAIIHIFAVHMY
ncbi:MAG: pyridine nucleotide-disulfide oxidoreductase [Gammaproteobacteria bacterium]|nr:pyridine nucleotide-disulfide oxidoreductase [Gammaproteobacteria bacterium]